MNIIEHFWPLTGRKAGLVLVTIIVAAGLWFYEGADEAPVQPNATLPAVTLTTATEFAGGQSLSLIGTVRAFSEAAITTERAGRVTSVPVKLGNTVRAGQVIATLENASEQAAVLQAEGVYEAAQANAEQSGVSVSEANTNLRNAQNNAVSTFKSSYNTVNGIVLNSVDPFFSSPNASVPGLRIDGRGFTSTLNNERVAFQTVLPIWSSKTQAISVNADLSTELDYAESVTQQTIDMVDVFLTVFSQQSGTSRYTDAELNAFRTEFTNLRSTLIGIQSNIDAARSQLENATDAVRRAELGATGGTTSAADAQIKQALGSLRAAQANLAKTVLRSPISGTINAISVRQGDFVNLNQQVAEVANNNALEIVTYISDSERGALAVGDTVTIENEFTGTVTQIAPAVDRDTRKIEARIAAEGIDIQNGDTVRITKTITEPATDTILVPLSAVKFSAENGTMFQVEDGVLVAREVTVGRTQGGAVEITAGLGLTDSFVTDARGLQAGTQVEVAQ